MLWRHFLVIFASIATVMASMAPLATDAGEVVGNWTIKNTPMLWAEGIAFDKRSNTILLSSIGNPHVFGIDVEQLRGTKSGAITTHVFIEDLKIPEDVFMLGMDVDHKRGLLHAAITSPSFAYSAVATYSLKTRELVQFVENPCDGDGDGDGDYADSGDGECASIASNDVVTGPYSSILVNDPKRGSLDAITRDSQLTKISNSELLHPDSTGRIWCQWRCVHWRWCCYRC